MSVSNEPFDASEMTTKLINDWLSETRGLPITLQLTKLGFAIIAGLEKAYELGGQRGYDVRSWIQKAVDELIDEEGVQGERGPDDSGIEFDGPDDDDTHEFPF